MLPNFAIDADKSDILPLGVALCHWAEAKDFLQTCEVIADSLRTEIRHSQHVYKFYRLLRIK
jgi:hypothetical protein